MERTYFIFEDIQTTPRRKLFTTWGVEWLATPYAWFNVVWLCITGVILAMFLFSDESLVSRLGIGIIYGILAYLVYILHNFGHILSGIMVGSPMQAVLLTGTRQVDLYTDTSEVPSRVHLGRALGGPVLNLIIGLVTLVVWRATDSHFALFFAIINFIFASGALFPIPSIDGEVIWRELRKGSTRG